MTFEPSKEVLELRQKLIEAIHYLRLEPGREIDAKGERILLRCLDLVLAGAQPTFLRRFIAIAAPDSRAALAMAKFFQNALTIKDE